MNKVLVEIFLPASGISYEMKIPRQLKVIQVLEMINNYLRNVEDAEYTPDADSVLCNANTGEIFESNAFIEELGLMNGAKIMLI